MSFLKRLKSKQSSHDTSSTISAPPPYSFPSSANTRNALIPAPKSPPASNPPTDWVFFTLNTHNPTGARKGKKAQTQTCMHTLRLPPLTTESSRAHAELNLINTLEELLPRYNNRRIFIGTGQDRLGVSMEQMAEWLVTGERNRVVTREERVDWWGRGEGVWVEFRRQGPFDR